MTKPPFRCQALITKEFKRTKAQSRYAPKPFVNPERLPICNGAITFGVRVYASLDGGSDALSVIPICSRCKYPDFPGRETLGVNPEAFLERMLNGDFDDD